MKLKNKPSEHPADYGMNPGLPIQQAMTDGADPTGKEVRSAVREINPDPNSEGHRG